MDSEVDPEVPPNPIEPWDDVEMHEEHDHEDRSIESVVRWLEAAHPEDAALGGPTAETGNDPQELREHLELVGLLAYQLDEEVPAPETRQRLLASVGDRLRSELRSSLGSAEVAVQPGRPELSEARPFDEVTLRERHSDPALDLDDRAGQVVDGSERFAGGRDQPPQRSTWQSPWLSGLLAASLALCLVGLGFLAGRSSEQQATIDRLDQEITRLAQGQGSVDLPVEGLLNELSATRRKLEMVTRVAHRAYPMDTIVPADPGAPQPDGMIYVCGAHQRWYLNVEGLEPAPAGKEYRLWFLTEKGPVAGGTLDVESGLPAEREASSMPLGTRGFSITLEAADDPADVPGGMMVLLGEDSVSL